MPNQPRPSPPRVSLVQRQKQQAQEFAVLRAKTCVKLHGIIPSPPLHSSHRRPSTSSRDDENSSRDMLNHSGRRAKDRTAREETTPVKPGKGTISSSLVKTPVKVQGKEKAVSPKGRVRFFAAPKSKEDIQRKRENAVRDNDKLRISLSIVEAREQERLLEIHKRKEAARLRRQKEQEYVQKKKEKEIQQLKEEEAKRKKMLSREKAQSKYDLMCAVERSRRERELLKMGVDPVKVARCSQALNGSHAGGAQTQSSGKQAGPKQKTVRVGLRSPTTKQPAALNNRLRSLR
eukprot:g71910.t1